MEDKKSIEELQMFSPVGDTLDGNVTLPDKEKEIADNDVDSIVSILNKQVKEEMSPKYQAELGRQAAEDPNSVMIETPKGWMTIAEAVKQGFSPETGDFTEESVEARIDRIISEQGLDPAEAEQVKAMVLRKEAEAAGAPMPEGELPMEGEESPEAEGELPPEEGVPAEGEAPIDPAMLAMMGGGA